MDLYQISAFPSKIVAFKYENPFAGRKVNILLVKEDLGF